MQHNEDGSASASPDRDNKPTLDDKRETNRSEDEKSNTKEDSREKNDQITDVNDESDKIADVNDEKKVTGGKESSIETAKESDEESDEESEPPLLKYTRINKLPSNFFSRDSISACLFQEDFFAFGTHAGLLHLTKPDFTPLQTIKCHRSSILSIHSDGSYFATGSIDGTVAIGLVEDPSNITAFDFKRPIQAVVLDSDYRVSKTFVSGGMAGEVILSQRNWLGNRVDTILSKGQGPIVGIYTVDDILLWMNDAGITFCSIRSRAQLLNVPYPKYGKNDVRPGLFRPHVHFPESDRIIIGWGNHVWMFKISLEVSPDFGKNFGSILSSAASSLRALPDKKVELEHFFETRVHIAGISSFKDDQLLCLGFEVDDNRYRKLANIPELDILDITTGEELHNDEVISKNYQNLSLNDYHLGKYIGKTSPEYFFISASDFICIKVLSLEDHYDWYLDKKNYLKAWEIGKYATKPNERLSTGVKYVHQLLDHEQWEHAASFVTLMIANTNFGDDDDGFREEALKQWGDIFMRIIIAGQVDCVAQNLPVDPPLDKSVYDSVLDYYLEESKLHSFMNCIQKWPLMLFSFQRFEDKLEEKIESHDVFEHTYRDAIIHLYLLQRRFTKAVPHMIKRKDKRVLNILLSHNLVSQFSDEIVEITLVPYDDSLENLGKLSTAEVQAIFEKSIDLLVRNRHSLEVSKIVKVLSDPKELRVILFLYLKKLSSVDPDITAPFENDMIRLYSDYEREELLGFLKKKSNYDVEKAIDFCSKRKGYYNELIFLWGKIGENKKALSLIIDELNDPKLAIEFVKNWGDSELWEFMVGYSMDKPIFVKALLDSPDELGRTYLEVIKAMPLDMKIDGLQATLIKIEKDDALNLQVSKSVFKIVDDETKEYGLEFLRIRNLGKVFQADGHT